MAYCRWSDDDYRCDLYCYEGDEGFVTHVAQSRLVYDGEPPQYAPCGKDYAEISASRRKFFDGAKRIPIGLSHDGDISVDDDLPSLLTRIKSLRELGYRVPDYVIDDIEGEIRINTEGAGNSP